jgi:hypothetical protein
MLKNTLVGMLLLVACFGFGQNSILDTPDIMDEVEGLKYEKGAVKEFSVFGVGIITAKPDNIFIQFSIKSDPETNLKAAEVSAQKKADFIIDSLVRYYKLKKTSIKIINVNPQLIQQKIAAPKSLQKKNESGEVIANTVTKYQITKYIVVNDLGKTKMTDIYEIIDKAVSYGASALKDVDIPRYVDSTVEESNVTGEATRAMSAFKGGASKLKMTTAIKDNNNQLVNYHFNEDTLAKMQKEARGKARAEIKEKFDKAKSALKINENDFVVSYKEDNSVTSTEDYEITMKLELTAVITRVEEKKK